MTHDETDQHTVIRTMLLQLPKRRRLYEAIIARPGLHARRLSRQLDMALGVVEHHAYQLERHGLVFSHQSGRRRTYFAAGQVTSEEAVWIHALRKPEWGPLIEALASTGPCGVGPLSVRLEVAPALLGYHLRRMRDVGLLDHLRVGRDSVYAVRDPDRVTGLMILLHPEAAHSVPDAGFTGVVGRADEVAQGPVAAPKVQPDRPAIPFAGPTDADGKGVPEIAMATIGRHWHED